MIHRAHEHYHPQSKKNDAFRVWRVLHPLSHIFDNNVAHLFEIGRISEKLKNYLEIKGWPLSKQKFQYVHPDVWELFSKIEPEFEHHEYQELGMQVADLAYALMKMPEYAPPSFII